MVISAQDRYLAHKAKHPTHTVDDISTALGIPKTMCHTFAGHLTNGTKYNMGDCQTFAELDDALSGWVSGDYLCTGYIPDDRVEVIDPKGVTHVVSMKDFMEDDIDFSRDELLKPSVQGVGFIGIGNYPRMKYRNHYARWCGILARCYSEYPSRKNVYLPKPTVCEEWLNFQNFAEWMETQDWKGKELDKDLKQLDVPPGSRVFSPKYCQFITSADRAKKWL